MKKKAILHEWLHTYSFEEVKPCLQELSSSDKEFNSFVETYNSLKEEMPKTFSHAYSIMLVSDFTPVNAVPTNQENKYNVIGVLIYSDSEINEPLCLARCILFFNRSHGEKWRKIRKSLFITINEMSRL